MLDLFSFHQISLHRSFSWNLLIASDCHRSLCYPISSELFSSHFVKSSLLLNRVRSVQLLTTAFNWLISPNYLQLTYLIWHLLNRVGPISATFVLGIFLCPSNLIRYLSHRHAAATFFFLRGRAKLCMPRGPQRHTRAGWCCPRSARTHAVSLRQPRRHHPNNSGSHAVRRWCAWWRGQRGNFFFSWNWDGSERIRLLLESRFLVYGSIANRCEIIHGRASTCVAAPQARVERDLLALVHVMLLKISFAKCKSNLLLAWPQKTSAILSMQFMCSRKVKHCMTTSANFCHTHGNQTSTCRSTADITQIPSFTSLANHMQRLKTTNTKTMNNFPTWLRYNDLTAWPAHNN